jgi:hypothetical protein
MRAIRPIARAVAVMLVLSANAGPSGAAPKTYVFTGRFTSNRGPSINIPLIGSSYCPPFVGWPCSPATPTVMRGPGGKIVPAPDTPATRTAGMRAANYGVVREVPGKRITTTGAGVGGAFVMPTKVFSRPAPSYVAALHVPNATPAIQIATSFRVTGPRKTPSLPAGGAQQYQFPLAALHAFKKGAWMTQTGRAGSAFTWCFRSPGCARITQGTKPLIVKYSGGGNAFGGTMAYVINAGPNVSSLAIGFGGGAVGFARLTSAGSQPTGRGYVFSRIDKAGMGPVWAFYKTMTIIRPKIGVQKLITMVTGFLGNNFPSGVNSNVGFPWTTRTVLARNTGTQAGNPKVTTLTAKGGDSVTAMGRRNISLVAGGVAHSQFGPLLVNTPEIAQMVLPEPSRGAQLAAGILALLVVATRRAGRR